MKRVRDRVVESQAQKKRKVRGSLVLSSLNIVVEAGLIEWVDLVSLLSLSKAAKQIAQEGLRCASLVLRASPWPRINLAWLLQKCSSPETIDISGIPDAFEQQSRRNDDGGAASTNARNLWSRFWTSLRKVGEHPSVRCLVAHGTSRGDQLSIGDLAQFPSLEILDILERDGEEGGGGSVSLQSAIFGALLAGSCPHLTTLRLHGGVYSDDAQGEESSYSAPHTYKSSQPSLVDLSVDAETLPWLTCPKETIFSQLTKLESWSLLATPASSGRVHGRGGRGGRGRGGRGRGGGRLPQQ